VKFDILDGSGNSIVWPDQQSFMVQEVPIILPGAKVAVGDALALTESARRDPAAVARIAVTAKATQTLPAGDGNTGLGAVTATVVAGKGKRDADGSGSVAFTADSANCAPLVSRGTSMIFRDSAGKIVGGSLSTSPASGACEPGQSGEDSVTSTLRSIPETADLDRTELTAYCDFTKPTPGGLDAPVN
jgi:hypothetical protein